ncbi:hypothetical protein MSKOL_1431 [Methanosarcina sp. Kolksee]|uniref:hypothetical protein n=1 Tax=Methanosarcina sp. Kolksee TaxID=1434099 RepID=UPI000615AB2B|nr:hypothetical protein [Methanosarcina sp. Kolksee]AKB47208.1 hypothetical protein MSKOL_1431 [Methanosarcina sp. Kolksee]
MQLGNAASVEWTQRVESSSLLRDPLGIEDQHLYLQKEFTVGITSVTPRARYYTIWAYYYEYLYRTGVVDPNKFEKIFILSSLAHHKGNYQSPDLIHMYNNQKFANDWNQKTAFTLDFIINGYGRVYYNRQMEVFRCAWMRNGQEYISKINAKLANTLSFLDPNDFERESFTIDELNNLFNGFCICQTSQNSEENKILSKLMFGFFSEKNGNADIDDLAFNEYMKGAVKLDFINRPLPWTSFHDYYSLQEQNSRRRNTLLLFLKIIYETSPPSKSEFRRYIWDAIYFNQNRKTKEDLYFGELENTRKYWEFFQLNLYYVYLVEKTLEGIQKIVMENIGIHKKNLINSLNIENIFLRLSEELSCDVNENTSMKEIFLRIAQINENTKSSLNSDLNESDIFNDLNVENLEIFLAKSITFLGLLYHRYNQNLQFIEKPLKVNDISSLQIEDLFSYLENNGEDENITSFFTELFRVLINRHFFISAQRFAENNTKNWLFTEEDGRLYSARIPIKISPLDNRWSSIRTIMTDLGFIYRDSYSELKLTDKGLLWLQQIK